MITKYKIFEKYWTDEDIKPTKLINHLRNIFIEFGYDTYYPVAAQDSKTTYFTKNGRTMFYMKGGLGDEKISFNLLDKGDEFIRFLIDYFKSIKGLTIDNYGGVQFDLIFDGDIFEIINQISKDDIEFKMNTNKYNL